MKAEQSRKLVLYMPVFHRGYLDFFIKHKEVIDQIFLIDTTFVSSLSPYEPDIAALETESVRNILMSLGFQSETVNEGDMSKLQCEKLLLINDAVSRNLQRGYFAESDVEWARVFLRWDQDLVVAEEPCDVPISQDKDAVTLMASAYEQAKNSSDWWRQVGAVLVKDGKIILSAYNKGVPADAEPYEHGAIRDFLAVGQKPELSSTIHAEQLIISQAAAHGISLAGTSIYVTHFPCTMCAKMITHSGIKGCFFGEGSSNGYGKEILEAGGVVLTKVIH